MRGFAEAINADITVMPNGEHWLHTEEQTEFREKWLTKVSSSLKIPERLAK
ncbi:MAG: hypothetical protein II842_16460 [Butyrivibrio sp.]|nr:hypothetical protein [Butyrivibrio sp.]